MTMHLDSFVTLVSALGCGLIAGTFFAFSTFVMRALGQIPSPHGIAAMQAINRTVLNPWFLGVFLGTGVLCIGLVIRALTSWSKPGVGWLFLGSGLYIVGSIVVTLVFNVPRNESLALVDPNAPEAASRWRKYLVTWTAWNHVRMVAATSAAASFTLGLWASRVSTVTP